MPIVPVSTAQHVKLSIRKPVKLLGADEPKLSSEEILSHQLPIDKLMGAPSADMLIENGASCTICEYFLHFVQEALASPINEENIKTAVATTCDKLPNKSIRLECHNFVDSYGDAVIALLIQDIDPRAVCPMLQICPKTNRDFEVFALRPIDVQVNSKNSGSEKCPMCLFAITEAEELIKSNKSKENIKHTLDGLCSHLSQKLKSECVDFVESYTEELMDMLSADFTPQDICVYLKLCTDGPDNELYPSALPAVRNTGDGDILTNEIPDDTVNGQLISTKDQEYSSGPDCILCTELVKEVEKRVINKKSRAQIKLALEHACDKLKRFRNKCEEYVEKHGDLIVDLIMKELTPKEICRELGFCILSSQVDDLDIDEALSMVVIAIPSDPKQFSKSVVVEEKLESIDRADSPNDSPCVLCEFVMAELDKELADVKERDKIEAIVKNVCKKLPKSISAECQHFVDQYAALIISLISTVPPKEMCTQMHFCQKIELESRNEVLECAVCHEAVLALGHILETETPTIEQAVEKTCNYLPGKYYDRCVSMVEIYGQSIINIISKSGELQTICSQIGMCFPNEYHSFVQVESDRRLRKRSPERLVGSGKCTRGPAYWCFNQSNADECKASDYCAQKHWVNGIAPVENS